MKLPISAFIITKNEELNIAKAINSLKSIVDDLHIIDSGSEDNTVQIAENLGAKVIYNEWSGYIAQKIFGEKLCKHKWILNIDADEELTPELVAEIRYIFESKQQNSYKAYRINFVILHRNDEKPKFLAPANSFIRLYDKNLARFKSINSGLTHDTVLMQQDLPEQGNVKILSAPAYHRSATSIEQLVRKANFYTDQQAEDLINKGRIPNKLRIISEFFFWFLKAFFIRRYFVFGFDGFVDSIIFAFSRFIRLAKARELAQEKHRSTTTK